MDDASHSTAASPPPPLPHELFRLVPPPLGVRLLAELAAADRLTYRAAMVAVAQDRRLRPVYLERKPKPERHAWMHAALGRRSVAAMAGQVLQAWLVRCQAPLLCTFLDALDIAHDADGTVEAFPECPPPARLRTAVDAAFAAHDPAVARLYFQAFCALHPDLWPPFNAMLAADPRTAWAPPPTATPATGPARPGETGVPLAPAPEPGPALAATDPAPPPAP